MLDTTVTEAAALLGVGRTRVLQLISSGALVAEKVGHAWLIDGRSIQERLASGPKAGRPPAAASRARTKRYLLMSRNHAVLSFRFDSSTGEFFDTDEIHDPSRAPLGIVSPRGKKVYSNALRDWWAYRTIPKGRTGIEEKLAELGIAETFDLPFRSMGLSLSDQYWVRPEDADLGWEDVNFFQNAFPESDAGPWLAEVGLDSPDNTSDGLLPKAWACSGSARVLLKGGTLLNQEPYNERIATGLHGRILEAADFVPYSLAWRGADVVSSCPNFVGPTEEFIPAFYVRGIESKPSHRDDFRHYVECCESLGAAGAERALQKMIVCDDLIANHDRHWRNFGLIRDVETLECRMAPIFDSGTSLWCWVPTSSLPYSTFSFSAKPFADDPNAQLRLVNDFSWLDLDALTGFPEAVADALDENPLMAGRVDFVFEGVASRLEHLLAIAS